VNKHVLRHLAVLLPLCLLAQCVPAGRARQVPAPLQEEKKENEASTLSPEEQLERFNEALDRA
jgi:hypothetical protein